MISKRNAHYWFSHHYWGNKNLKRIFKWMWTHHRPSYSTSHQPFHRSKLLILQKSLSVLQTLFLFLYSAVIIRWTFSTPRRRLMANVSVYGVKVHHYLAGHTTELSFLTQAGLTKGSSSQSRFHVDVSKYTQSFSSPPSPHWCPDHRSHWGSFLKLSSSAGHANTISLPSKINL